MRFGCSIKFRHFEKKPVQNELFTQYHIYHTIDSFQQLSSNCETKGSESHYELNNSKKYYHFHQNIEVQLRSHIFQVDLLGIEGSPEDKPMNTERHIASYKYKRDYFDYFDYTNSKIMINKCKNLLNAKAEKLAISLIGVPQYSIYHIGIHMYMKGQC